MHIHAPELYYKKRNRKLTKHDPYILQCKGIHAKNIADDLNVTERFIISRQRKLGLRLLTTGNPNGRGGKSRGETHC